MQKLNGASVEKKAKKKELREDSINKEEADSEEEHDGNSKSKRSRTGTGGTKKWQEEASPGDSSSRGEQRSKSATKAQTKRERLVPSGEEIAEAVGNRSPASGGRRRRRRF